MSSRKVVVTGDVMIESKIARDDIYESDPNPSAGYSHDLDPTSRKASDPLFGPRVYLHSYTEAGGAALLWNILWHALRLRPVAELRDRRAMPNLLKMRSELFDDSELTKSFWHSNLVAAQYRKNTKGRDRDASAVWRIKEKLGIDRQAFDALDRISSDAFPLAFHGADEGDADLVIVEHLKQGFAEHQKLWPESLLKRNGDARWLLVRWSHPELDKNTNFWNAVVERFRNRIVVVVTVEHLRFFGMQISRGLSWEQAVTDLYKEIDRIWDKALNGCAHLVVSFFPSGAVIFSKPAGTLSAKLVYDPTHMEGSWADDYEGDMMGYTRCVTAGIALEMMLSPKLGELGGKGVAAGLQASRYLLMHGFTASGAHDRKDTALPRLLVFPVATVARVLGTAFTGTIPHRDDTRTLRLLRGGASQEASDSAEAITVQVNEFDEVDAWVRGTRRSFETEDIGNLEQLGSEWRLLDLRVPKKTTAIIARASNVVKYGSIDLPWEFPTLRIGKLFVTDRREMESLRAVRELMLNYMSSQVISSPLSIAVFGPPGSGKSFAIKELARHLSADLSSRVPRVPIEDITFNVSQFSGVESLASALHSVRDIALAGRIPLVFWDEFDTNREIGSGATLGWLRSFLAPMQDGQFQDGVRIHNVGRAIFVFAGGTHKDMAEFRKDAVLPEMASVPAVPGTGGSRKVKRTERDALQRAVDANQRAVEAKLPDFISRLKGFVNIPTLNYDAGMDAAIALRRAELLRSFLWASAGNLIQPVQWPMGEDQDRKRLLLRRLNIDQGLIDAFLRVSKYTYGARSMEAIVKMSALTGKHMYDRSSLPPADQLALHVNSKEFLGYAGAKWADTDREQFAAD